MSTAAFRSDGRFDTRAADHHGRASATACCASPSRPTFLESARASLLRGSLMIAAAAIAISIVLQLALGLWLTRHLRRLTAAGEAMAGGDLSARVAVESDDEVGQLAAAFNTMAESVADRMRELRASEAKFHAIADYSYGCELWMDPQRAAVVDQLARGDHHRLHGQTSVMRCRTSRCRWSRRRNGRRCAKRSPARCMAPPATTSCSARGARTAPSSGPRRIGVRSMAPTRRTWGCACRCTT